MCENPLRALPKMDVLLSHPTLLAARKVLPYALIRQAARGRLEEVRRSVVNGAAVPPVDVLAGEIAGVLLYPFSPYELRGSAPEAGLRAYGRAGMYR